MAAGFRLSSRKRAPLKLVHVLEDERSDTNSPFPDQASTDLHSGVEADDGFQDSSFCAFCASPLSDSGAPCCADYAATIEQSPAAVVAPQPLAAPAAPAAPAPAARSFFGSYVLLGLLVTCVIALGVALALQMRNAAEAQRQFTETRRISEEMIALMKETRRQAAQPAVVPSSGEVAVAAPADRSEEHTSELQSP